MKMMSVVRPVIMLNGKPNEVFGNLEMHLRKQR